MSKTIKLAICSRDSEENYQWLIDFLTLRMSTNTKIRVNPVYITNNASQFYRDVAGYDFTILYHTKKRGRINITDVTDSLYDQELKFLGENLGKKRVAVVIDDLDKCDDIQKEEIKRGQPCLVTFAQEVFLFTAQDHQFTIQTLKTMTNEGLRSRLRELKDCIKQKSGKKHKKEKKDKKKKKKIKNDERTAL